MRSRGGGVGGKESTYFAPRPYLPHTTSCSFFLLSTALLHTGAERGAAVGPRGVPGGGRAPADPHRQRHLRSAGAEREGCGLPGRGHSAEGKNCGVGNNHPQHPPSSSRTSLRPAGLPAGVSLKPAWDSGSPVTCGRAGRGRAAERCGAGSPPPPLRRGRARGRARAGRAGRCPPRSPRQCQGGLGLCGHLPRSPLPAAGGRGIFSIASLYSSPKVSPTYLFICRRAPRCRRAARAAPRRAERWKRLGIAAGRAER